MDEPTESVRAQKFADLLGISETVSKWKYGNGLLNCTLSAVRIEEAKRLVVQRNLTIREPGGRAGYQNTACFCKVFKRMTGSTISEY